eukprot:Tbor_TRINITY_DN6067_c1_g1::TRINITY_DN6067_c1_g1_i3::g.10133::m.10133
MDVPPIETNIIDISVSSHLYKSDFKPGKSAVSMGICPSSYPTLASNILTPSSSVPTDDNSNPTVSGKHSLNHQRMVSGSHSPYPLKEAVLCGKSRSSIFDYRDWLDGNLYKMVPSDIEDECDVPNLDRNNNTKKQKKNKIPKSSPIHSQNLLTKLSPEQ